MGIRKRIKTESQQEIRVEFLLSCKSQQHRFKQPKFAMSSERHTNMSYGMYITVSITVLETKLIPCLSKSVSATLA